MLQKKKGCRQPFLHETFSEKIFQVSPITDTVIVTTTSVCSAI
jgi:hypothetical protein